MPADKMSSPKKLTKFFSLKFESPKQDEIDALDEIRRAIPNQTYLDSLIGADLLEWFEEKARNDFSTDIMADYRSTEKELQQAHIDLQAARAALDAVVKERDETRRAYDALKANTADEIRAMSQKVAEHQTARIQAELATDCIKNALDQLVGELQVLAKDAWFNGAPVDLDELKAVTIKADKAV